MTEPPRPPGDGRYGPPPDPTSPPPPPGQYSTPGEASGPGYAPPPPAGQPYSPPPPPTGYGAPPGGAYPGAAGPGYPPPGYASNEDKTWALIAHFGGAAGMLISGGVLGWLAPLIAMLARGQQSPTVRQHAVAALNFQLLWSIIAVIGYVLGVCGLIVIVGAVFFIVPFAATVIGIVFGIIAGIRANEGQLYRYPMSMTMVK
jgi:uncharacterized protein